MAKYKDKNNHSREIGSLGRFYYGFLKNVICAVVGFIWARKVSGLENVPRRGAFLLVPNHGSFIDFMVVIYALRHIRLMSFFVKSKYFDMKAWNHFLAKMSQIRADRSSIKKALTYLKSGIPVVLFAEGTRTRDGEIGNAYPGLAMISGKVNVPVVPVGIKGAYDLWPWDKKFPNPLDGRAISISFGKPIFLKSFSSPKELSDSVMAEIKKLAS